MKKIKVLIIDDSAVARKCISESLSGCREIEIVGTALDPFIAAEKIKTVRPDVLTLDIEMPRMDGITFLSKLMIALPMPVIMVSAFTDRGAKATIQAMEAGAVDFILKPGVDDNHDNWGTFGRELAEKIIIAAKVTIERRGAVQPLPVQHKAPDKSCGNCMPSDRIIAIGASTGGTEVITHILSSMEESCPGIVVTQHMPPKFTLAFANRIDGLSKINVKEAEHGDRMYTGSAYIAPGGTQMRLKKDTGGYWLEVNDDPPVNRHKPSVDVLFSSVADTAAADAMGIILTGMGNDGSSGLLEMKDAGAVTVAQDEASSIVFGMPREAIKIGAAEAIMNIEEIIGFIKQY